MVCQITPTKLICEAELSRNPQLAVQKATCPAFSLLENHPNDFRCAVSKASRTLSFALYILPKKTCASPYVRYQTPPSLNYVRTRKISRGINSQSKGLCVVWRVVLRQSNVRYQSVYASLPCEESRISKNNRKTAHVSSVLSLLPWMPHESRFSRMCCRKNTLSKYMCSLLPKPSFSSEMCCSETRMTCLYVCCLFFKTFYIDSVCVLLLLPKSPSKDRCPVSKYTLQEHMCSLLPNQPTTNTWMRGTKICLQSTMYGVGNSS
jgi:hypothetical protein